MGIKNSLVGGDMLETGAGIAASKTIIGGIMAAKAFKLIGGMPFVIMAVGVSPRMNLVRIIEALIIAGITAGVVMYANQQTMGVKIEGMSAEISELKKSMDDIRRDFYAPKFREIK